MILLVPSRGRLQQPSCSALLSFDDKIRSFLAWVWLSQEEDFAVFLDYRIPIVSHVRKLAGEIVPNLVRFIRPLVSSVCTGVQRLFITSLIIFQVCDDARSPCARRATSHFLELRSIQNYLFWNNYCFNIGVLCHLKSLLWLGATM